MQQFSIMEEAVTLCDTPQSWIDIRGFAPGVTVAAQRTPPIEVVLCVVEGEVSVVAGAETFSVERGAGVQLPAGQPWQVTAGAAGAKLLRVDSFHPGFTPEKSLMPPLAHPHRFTVAGGQKLIYTDYVRGGVLTFAPGFVADKHFHQDADEIFWFFQGTCRVTVPGGAFTVPAGTIIYTAPYEWHMIENVGDEPLLMFLTVTPNIVPSHTFFDANGDPFVRSWEPLRKMG
ncbi:MAG: cupin domain-containing protein [Caldilineaceae bacterium]|nr:cupin domain-containing protein [Caldilineaceae bacterium]